MNRMGQKEIILDLVLQSGGTEGSRLAPGIMTP